MRTKPIQLPVRKLAIIGVVFALAGCPGTALPGKKRTRSISGRPFAATQNFFLKWLGIGSYHCDGAASTPRLERILVDAVKRGDYWGTRNALVEGAWVEAKNDRNSPVLMMAAGRKYNRIMKLLLKAGADVNSRGAFRGTALDAAAGFDNLEGVTLLLKAGAEINTVDGYHRTPLHHAEDPAVVRVLVKAGADLNIRDKGGYSPVSFITKAPILKAVLDSLAPGSHPIDLSAPTLGHQKTILTQWVCHSEFLDPLLPPGMDLSARDARGWTPLMEAAARGCTESISLLVERGAALEERSPDGRTALAHAAANGMTSVIAQLVSLGADIDCRDSAGMTPMLLGLSENKRFWKSDRVDVTRTLLKLGADIHQTDTNGRTALMWSARSCNVDSEKLLIKSGARLNIQDIDGRTALHHAFQGLNLHQSCGDFHRCVKYLVVAGADTRIPDADGYRPLDFARAFPGLPEFMMLAADQQ